MQKAMAFWGHWAAMLFRSRNSLSEMSATGLKARKAPCLRVDNKSVVGREREKEFFENERTRREYL
jgi:hypothetical protein